MSYANDKKFSIEDFSSIESIDALGSILNNNFNKNDANGYTPLCFAAINNVSPDLLIYMAYSVGKPIHDKWPYKGKGADINKRCFKGKTPIELAVTSGNSNAIKVFLGGEVEVTALNKYMAPDVKYGDDCLPITDSDGKFVYNTVKVKLDKAISYNTNVNDPNNDRDKVKELVTCAASFPKSDMLLAVADLECTREFFSCSNYNRDNQEKTPLLLVTEKQLYDSADIILKTISADQITEETEYSIYNDTESPHLVVVEKNKDIGMLITFAKYYETDNFGHSSNGKSSFENSLDNLIALADSSYEPLIDLFSKINSSDNDYYIKYNGCNRMMLIIDRVVDSDLYNDFVKTVVDEFNSNRIKSYIDSCHNASASQSSDRISKLYNIINSLYKENKLSATNIANIKFLSRNGYLLHNYLDPGLRY